MANAGLFTPEMIYTVEDINGEKHLSDESTRILIALEAPIERVDQFLREDNPFSPTPLDVENLKIGSLPFERVSDLFLEAVLNSPHLKDLTAETKRVVEEEIFYTTQRRLEKNATNMRLLASLLRERVDCEVEHGTPPLTVDQSLLDTVLDLRAGFANLEQRVQILDLFPEIGSMELTKTTCPCDALLAGANARHIQNELEELSAARSDWTIAPVSATDSQHRMVVQEGNVVSSKWISATISTAKMQFDVVTKQSNLILPFGSELLTQRNPRRLPDGKIYEVQPLTIMQYLRPSKLQ